MEIMPITNNEAIEHIKKLADYCLEHKCCRNCIFVPKNYKAGFDECILEQPPCDAIALIRRNNNREYGEE